MRRVLWNSRATVGHAGEGDKCCVIIMSLGGCGITPMYPADDDDRRQEYV